MTGWPVNEPLKTDKPTGFGLGVTVRFPMTIWGTGYLESAISKVHERSCRVSCGLRLVDIDEGEKLKVKICLPLTEGKIVVDAPVVVAPGAAAGVDCW